MNESFTRLLSLSRLPPSFCFVVVLPCYTVTPHGPSVACVGSLEVPADPRVRLGCATLALM